MKERENELLARLKELAKSNKEMVGSMGDGGKVKAALEQDMVR
eukprot:SAG31_NODE_36586_length_312_cov_0.708920_1_plen_43_part_00